MITPWPPSGWPRRVPVSHDETVALLEVLAQHVDSLGPEADVNETPLTPSRLPSLVAGMQAVGIDPAVVHAYEQTGVLVSAGNEDLWSAAELERWEAAIEAYRSHDRIGEGEATI